jgi:glycosyltransferase involved in cell wall biosynthesis
VPLVSEGDQLPESSELAASKSSGGTRVRRDARESRVLVFEPFRGGHHPEYIRAIVEGWRRASIPGTLTVACPSTTVTQTSIELTATGSSSQIEHLDLPDLEPWPLVGRFAADRRHARSLEWAIRQVHPHDVVVMYLDRLLWPIATGLRLPNGTRLHGIYFRPSVHYDRLRSSQPSAREHARARVRHALFLAALRNPSMSTVFSLDPTFVDWVGSRRRTAILPCPDVLNESTTPAETRARRRRWNIAPERSTALFFGFLAYRKGVGSVCEALRLLEQDEQRRLAVVFCGRAVPEDGDRIHEALDRVARETSVQIVVDEQDLHFTQVQSAFEATDVALVPYLRHIGSSAVLLRAAAARKPVIASDFGLVGHYVATHRLGQAIDSRDPRKVAGALSEWLKGGDLGFDAVRAAELGRVHGARLMADTILSRVVDGRVSQVEKEAA